ncbi:adenosylcobinamide-GDP ribazoletransferase [Pseudovibrio sp. SPO723]|uniref:adenosylcobinamide-GDP ribazoletransferase n=1 Tax=Nesiotobacter zosterae TaxID=392721 RepID=UPI0029C41EE2|nr:adenosylcobinamide-GDP ribazoletransferase [Pseudovibrio sp. SPO723]MDX5593614.1 adenosylcobinamide-GDP ribazoletransferase [Pseudovibrio sp. SPO723]
MPNQGPVEKTETREQPLAVDIVTCIRFFSRIPVPCIGLNDRLDQAPDFRRTARAIPLAGLLISLPAALVLLIFSFTGLPVLATALIAVATTAILTGCLHEDGLADVFDGFFGGTTRQKRLEIMHDSRIGTFGTLALIFTVGLRIVLLGTALEEIGGFATAMLYLMAETIGRSSMVAAWHSQPSANPGGLGHRFGLPDWEAVIWSVLTTLVLWLLTLLALPLSQLLLGSIVSLGVAVGFVAVARSKIGGVSGDVLGALQQICSISFLFGCALL